MWSVFLPHINDGSKYKYCFIDELGNQSDFKSDPYAIQSELRPKTASMMHLGDIKELDIILQQVDMEI
ncbi:1,4-alpha-glucan branching enzyme GlgB [Clostridioides difficile]|nr:1,4-alpha-glucan branching enzyme GlgB [Clostridioides difficile]